MASSESVTVEISPPGETPARALTGDASIDWLPSGRPPRLLIVRLSAIGDVLHALPTLAALRAQWPAARIDWVVEDRAASALEARSDLNRVVVFPRRELAGASRGASVSRLRSGRAFVGRLREQAYDAVLDLQGNLKSGLVARLARAPLRCGPDRRGGREGNHLFLSRRVAVPSTVRHRVERNLALASALVGRPLAWRDPGFPRERRTEEAADALLERVGLPRAGGFALLHPGTSGFGRFKRWPADRFGALARRLAGDGMPIAATGGPGERDLVADLVAAAGVPIAALEPPDLPTLAALQARAAIVIAPDTGPLHLAALVGAPVLGLFGPKDPAVYGPYGRRSDGSIGCLDAIVREEVACRPCARRRCDLPLCMTTLDPDHVHARARAVLAASHPN